MTLAELNALDDVRFAAALASVFEHSPWVASAVAAERPFADLASLHRAMMDVVLAAPLDTRLALVRAHPELAGKAAIRGELTPESTREQSAAGLDHCSADEFAQLQAMNASYNAAFGFPFIIAVKGLDRAAILERFAVRLSNEPAAELDEALGQIRRITRFRLDALLSS